MRNKQSIIPAQHPPLVTLRSYLKRATDDRRHGNTSTRGGIHKTQSSCGSGESRANSRTGAAVVHGDADIEETDHGAVVVEDADVDVVGALPLVSVVDSLACSVALASWKEER